MTFPLKATDSCFQTGKKTFENAHFSVFFHSLFRCLSPLCFYGCLVVFCVQGLFFFQFNECFSKGSRAPLIFPRRRKKTQKIRRKQIPFIITSHSLQCFDLFQLPLQRCFFKHVCPHTHFMYVVTV